MSIHHFPLLPPLLPRKAHYIAQQPSPDTLADENLAPAYITLSNDATPRENHHRLGSIISTTFTPSGTAPSGPEQTVARTSTAGNRSVHLIKIEQFNQRTIQNLK